MKKSILTFCLIFIGLFACADKASVHNKKSEVKPNSSLTKQIKSFNVGGLLACTVEFETSDAIAEYTAPTNKFRRALLKLKEKTKD